jgi:hypothetical protein
MRPYPVIVLALAALAAGVISATASGERRRPPASPVPAPRVAAPLPAVPRCAADKPAAGKAPSERLLGAFSILRRERGADDELPREALDALRLRGLRPADPASARLLRATAEGGRAWVVPVADVRTAGIFGVPCHAERPPRIVVSPRRPVPDRPLPAPVLPAPVPLPVRLPAGPQEGLVVVALGGAPGGGGGARDDLIRGRAPVTVDPCAGPKGDMLGVSGIVPDGVASAYLTSADGTAVRADVRDNGYSFVVPRTRRPQQRYVVWTGGDGTPHVQPVALFPFTVRCRPGVPAVARVTPDGPFLVRPAGPALPVAP